MIFAVPSTIEELASRSCVPCKGTKPMTLEDANALVQTIPGWRLSDSSIEKEFRFRTYRAGLEFAYSVGMIAENQDHHPDILIKWRKVKLIFSTHIIKGLSQNDFVMAAKSEIEYLKHAAPA